MTQRLIIGCERNCHIMVIDSLMALGSSRRDSLLHIMASLRKQRLKTTGQLRMSGIQACRIFELVLFFFAFAFAVLPAAAGCSVSSSSFQLFFFQ